jgi:hypothetical protein
LTLEDFREGLLQDVLARARLVGVAGEAAFTEIVASELMEAGELETFEYCHYRHETLGLRVDGYCLAEEELVLTLVATDFRQGDQVETLTKRDAEDGFRRLRKFCERARDEKFYERIEPTSPGYDLAHSIHERRGSYNRVRFLLFTDARLGERTDIPADSRIGGLHCSYQVWDVTRLHRLAESQSGREDITIDFNAAFGQGLPCLVADVDAGAYQSYLIVMPGRILADLYEEHGDRLLEQNVRTYLQARGGINSGIKRTIVAEPTRFFAYNNGLTATAEDVDTRMGADGLQIVRLRNLQIVNGGQTTASLFHARLKDKASLDRVYVQMKLSVIKDQDTANEIIPKISEYANSQNRINAADFFANSPFHLRVEDLSRRQWAPSNDGGALQTHWFYERARGQYANAQAALSPSDRRKFQLQNPKSQLITKTDLAKFENSWAGLPHIVSLGAQKNFADFAKRMGGEWEKQPLAFNERWFKTMIAKAILFRETERMIGSQRWYGGGYRANIVTYTVASLAHNLRARRKVLAFDGVWQAQSISAEILAQLETIAEAVNAVVTSPPPGMRNVTEWCKKLQCWERVSSIVVQWQPAFLESVIDESDARSLDREARGDQALTDQISAEMTVVNLGSPFWQRLLDWNRTHHTLTDKEVGVVGSATKIPQRIPSEKQCQVIIRALERARGLGFDGGR